MQYLGLTAPNIICLGASHSSWTFFAQQSCVVSVKSNSLQTFIESFLTCNVLSSRAIKWNWNLNMAGYMYHLLASGDDSRMLMTLFHFLKCPVRTWGFALLSNFLVPHCLHDGIHFRLSCGVPHLWDRIPSHKFIQHKMWYCFLVVLKGACSPIIGIVIWYRILLSVDLETHPSVDVSRLESVELFCRELMTPIVRPVHPVVKMEHQLTKATFVLSFLCGIIDMDAVSHREGNSFFLCTVV
jgi:hypothetical protein